MIKVENKSRKRSTLDVQSVLNLSQIKLSRISALERYQALSFDEIESISWINPISDLPTHIIMGPKSIEPQIASPQGRKCEVDIKDFENKGELTPEKYVDIINDKNYIGTYSSIPIVDSRINSIIEKNSFCFSNGPPVIKYIHVTNTFFNGSASGVGNNNTIYHLLSYCKMPISETLRIDFAENPPLHTVFNYSYSDFYIPYIYDPGHSYLIVFLLSSEECNGKYIEKPFAVGFYRIDNENPPKVIQFDWYAFNPKIPLEQHIGSSAKLSINFGLQTQFTNEIQKSNTMRLLSFNSFYPSPFLAIYNLKLKLPKKLNLKGSLVGCEISILSSDGKTLELGTSPYSLTFSETVSSYYLIPDDELYFPSSMCFYLNNQVDSSLSVIINVFSWNERKGKLILSQAFPITSAIQDHENKMLNKSSIFSGLNKGMGGRVCFSTMFPIIVSQPLPLQPRITEKLYKPDYSHSMFMDSIPNILQSIFLIDNIAKIDFATVIDIIKHCDKPKLYSWIENYFVPSKNFTSLYLDVLIQNVSNIFDSPDFFFHLALKSMITEKVFSLDQIDKLMCKLSSQSIDIRIRKAASTFLLHLRMYFDIRLVLKAAMKWLYQSTVDNRLDIYQVLLTDIGFVHGVMFFSRSIMTNFKQSPYIPFFSLLFSTIRQSFLKSIEEAVSHAVDTIAVLSVTLEKYSSEESVIDASTVLFPLLTIIFTFYDFVKNTLHEDTRMIPMVLFIIKYCSYEQFIEYFLVLAEDSQFRFFDFLGALCHPSMISLISKNSVNLSNHLLSCTMEVTWRLLKFFGFLEELPRIENQSIRSLLGVFFQIISPQQDSEAFVFILKALAFVIKKFSDIIFVQKTDHILSILDAVLPLTQRKLYEARICSIGFINWICQYELTFHRKAFSCFLCLNISICRVFFEVNGFIRFTQYLPEGLSPIDQVIKVLEQAKNESCFYQAKIDNLMNVHRLYKNFPSIRFYLYKEAIRINKMNNDHSAAFINQWRLCSLIADITKKRNIIIEGIPNEGSYGFKLIGADNPVDLSSFPESSAYLLLEGSHFTESSLSEELKESMKLCQTAGFHWLIGPVSEFLLGYLEKKREFEALKEIFILMNNSYNELAKLEKPLSRFYLVSMRGPAFETLKNKDTIQMFSGDHVDSFCIKIKEMFPDLEFIKESEPLILTSPAEFSKNLMQIFEVNYDETQLSNLSVTDFSFQKFGLEASWGDLYVQRYNIKTKGPLPNISSNIAISECVMKRISRFSYYIDVLSKYFYDLNRIVEDFGALLPPKKLSGLWGKTALNINEEYLISTIGRVLSPSHSEEKCFHFTRMLLFKEISEKDSPEKLNALIDNIWKCVSMGVNYYFQLNKLKNQNTRDSVLNNAIILEYQKVLSLKNTK